MFTKPFSEIGRNDASTAGGKGASLGEMTQAGIPVPPGFVLLSDAFERFLQEAGLVAEIEAILHTVSVKEMHTIEHASEKIQTHILNAEMPADIAVAIEQEFKKLGAQYVAVRSSATAEDSVSAAWAGQLDTYLNTTEDTLLKNIQKCWASLFTPRAIFYRFEKGLHSEHISVAVVIQAMVNSELSGIAFSVHPVTEDKNQLIIEAGYGLGEAIVSGQVTPDSYVVSKEPRTIIESVVNAQTKALYRADSGGNEWRDIAEPQASAQVLTTKQILELSDVIVGIENHYGFPCDIEWAFESETFYITQSRPITTLSNMVPKTVLQKKFTRGFSLFVASMWRNADCKSDSSLYGPNVTEALWKRPGKEDTLEVWYSQKTYDTTHAFILEKSKDPEWFPKVRALFNEYWEPIYSYYTSEKPLTLEELKDFHEKIVLWWSPMMVMYIGAQLPVPEDMQKEMLSLRAKVEKYSDDDDEVYMHCAELVYPHMKEYFHVLKPEEVFSGVFPPKEELEERKRGWYMTNNEFGDLQQLPSVLEKMNWTLELPPTEGVTEIKGTTAYSGVVSGVARVVTNKKELETIQEGDILVAAMTTPEFLPYMHKAAAFVTDEGGVTCHAAIVAREMKKPCVIGTRFATTILKTGDRIEVDAERGIVKILKQNKKYTSEDYHLWFQATGINFLFTDLCARFYSQFNSVVVSTKGQYRYYVHTQDMASAEKTYKDLYQSVSTIEKISRSFLESKHNLLHLKDEIVGKDKVTEIDFEKFVDSAAHMFNEYSKFDHVYTDYLFKDTRPNIQEFITLVLEKKNVFREDINAIFFDEDSCLTVLVKFIARQLNVSNEDIYYSSIESIRGFLSGKEFIKTGTEHSDYALVRDENQYTYFFGAEATDFISKFVVQKDLSNVSNLQGISVSKKGVVQGMVQKIVIDYTNLKESVRALSSVPDGCVLVTDSTIPEMLPVMSKSLAIITDMGGMLSHAAITSRELNIPCVIGTKDATRVLKTGDMVEVDADNGIVRILDYVFFYESQGYRFLLDDLIVESYLQWPGIELRVGDWKRVYVPKNVIAENTQTGVSFTEEYLKQTLKNIQDLIQKLQKTSLDHASKETIVDVFSTFKTLFKEYSRYDPSYTEGMYAQNPNDARSVLIEKSKNVIRDDFDAIFFKDTGLLHSLITTIGELTQTPPEQITWYRMNEIEQLLAGGKPLRVEEINARKEASVFIRTKEGRISFFSGADAKQYLETFNTRVPASADMTQLLGTVAHGKGKKIRGSVCVIHRNYSDHQKLVDDMEGMAEGSILVTTITDPEFMPALKKASAIVTDIGGLLSHAAITARELDVPCIVGTEYATELLNNGDMVEVDTNTGQIRILQKAS